MIFHGVVQVLELMKRHGWKNMVLDVVIHVPVDPSIERAHVYGASVKPVVDGIFGKSCVLCKTEHHKEPMSVDAG